MSDLRWAQATAPGRCQGATENSRWVTTSVEIIEPELSDSAGSATSPTVLLRADMDALLVLEATGLPTPARLRPPMPVERSAGGACRSGFIHHRQSNLRLLVVLADHDLVQGAISANEVA